MFKKITLLGVMALLCLNFWAMAQEKKPTDTGKIKPKGNLQDTTFHLREVNISTGYQTLNRERATGSFVLIDSILLNRSVSGNILDRLDGVTSSLIFNKENLGTGYNRAAISIRGRSTINGDATPLLVVDNFPYYDSIDNINPADVESITVLKDAAAASIWGAKAGNGVIVITTKKGKLNSKLQVNLSSSFNIADKPRLFTRQQLSSAEFIEVEQFLFDKGKYDAVINNGYGVRSPAVELMLAYRNGQIGLDRRNEMLHSLSKFDVRQEERDYLYRSPIDQLYQLSVNGGSTNNSYAISGGFDKGLPASNVASNERFTLNANHSFYTLKNKLSFNVGFQFTQQNQQRNSTLLTNKYPYEHFVGENGEALPVTDGVLNLGYATAAGQIGLLDWRYKPLEENLANVTQGNTSLRLNIITTYNIANALKLAVYYQHQRNNGRQDDLGALTSYRTRNQINTITQLNQTTGEATRPIPLGDILRRNFNSLMGHSGRVQFDFRQVWGKHELSALAGFELNDYQTSSSSSILYGYNASTGVNLNPTIDFIKSHKYYYSNSSTIIPMGLQNGVTIDRYRSAFANFSYIWDNRYIISGGARKDESNIFGVRANEKGVPLWSAGLAWNLHNEKFYTLHWLPFLNLRTTFGHNGNVYKNISAYLTASSPTFINPWQGNYANIVNPPNPSLRWERVANMNVELEFALKNNLLRGNIAYYRKWASDLIGKAPIAPQTGVNTFVGNSATLGTKGIDVSLSLSQKISAVHWNSALLFNWVADKVAAYEVSPGNNYDIVSGNYNNPLVGYPYSAIFSYRWVGLSTDGSPQAYLDNAISTNYTAIRNSADRNDMVYAGAGTPTFFGSLRNSFTWRYLSVSFNVSYKLGYYFRRESLNNSNLYTGSYKMPDYGLRWQKPGDEALTDVPALIYPANANRTLIYTLADVLVEPGSHIRLQDIRLECNLKTLMPRIKVGQLQIFGYAQQLGLLWAANKKGIDPDNPLMLPSGAYAAGFKLNF